jgi:hypothetical protein
MLSTAKHSGLVEQAVSSPAPLKLEGKAQTDRKKISPSG